MALKHLIAAAALAWAACATAQQAKTLYVGQVSPLSGPAASIGQPVTQATHAYFRRINQNGGINGYRVELLDRDDGFLPERTMQEVKNLLADKPLVALVNIIGAPNNGDLVSTGLLDQNKIPVVGAFTGATSVRARKSPHMYFVRAGVADEARKMLAQMGSLGMSRIGLVHANDAFGKDAREHVESTLAAQKRKLVAQASYEPATIDVAPAVAALRAAEPQAILIFGTGPAAAKFVVEYRKNGGGAMLVANSSTSPDVLAKNAGDEYARGVGLSQAVPSLSKSATIPVIAEYLDTLKRYGDPQWKPSPYGLEGFLAAKLLAEGMRRAGPTITRESLGSALARIGQFNAGGITLDYSNGSREGLKTVDIGIMDRQGRLMN
jgi:ABC-type branched-subunit amino acid transport system substrate-binding protein